MLLKHALQTCPFPSISQTSDKNRDFPPNLLPLRQAQALGMQDLALWKCPQCCRANTPALTLPCSSCVVWIGSGFVCFLFGFFLLLFSSDGVKVHPIRHFIAAPDEKSPRDSRSRTAPGLESPRLASQPVPVPGGPGSPE